MFVYVCVCVCLQMHVRVSGDTNALNSPSCQLCMLRCRSGADVVKFENGILHKNASTCRMQSEGRMEHSHASASEKGSLLAVPAICAFQVNMSR